MATNPRGPSWQTKFMVAGSLYRETFDTKEEGEAWELEARAAIKRGQPVPVPKQKLATEAASLHTLGGLFDYVEREHWRNNPQISEPETALRNARFVVNFFGRNTLVKDIDEDELRRMVRAVVDQGLTHQTADRKLAALSVMLRYAIQKGVIQRKPVIPLSRIKVEHHRFLTPEEAHKLLKLWKDWDQEDLYDFTVFALHVGARLGAMLNLSWQRFGPGYKTVLFVGGKSSSRGGQSDKDSATRTLPLSGAARDAILRLKERHPDSKGPFEHFNRHGHLRTMWERMQKQLGFADVTIHTLRHTSASWQVQRGVNLRKVQQWLGHKNIETTLIYAHLAPGDLEATADVLGDILAPPKPALRVVK